MRETAAMLAPALAQADPEALGAALAAETQRRLADFLSGIEAYRCRGTRRRRADPPVLWQAGGTRLLDYGGDGAAVLLVPSLINRAYILDLTARRSFARYLAARGLRTLLVDWGTPSPEESAFTLDDYILGRLRGALDAAKAETERPVILLGYCMGGTLALPLAARHAQDLAGLCLLASPWDFHADGGAQARLVASLQGPLASLIAAHGVLPTDALQAMFASLDPLLAARKFRGFAARDPKSAAARDFVALEDWLNDGVPLAGPVATTCLFDWYVKNAPARGHWRVGGLPVRPQSLGIPVLNVVPSHDRIVPPASAAAVDALLPDAERWTPPLGHIGMIASPRAKRLLWRRLADRLAGWADAS